MIEDINFKLHFSTSFEKVPPHIKVYLNDMLMYDNDVVADKIVSFNQNLILETDYSLRIVRSGKVLDSTQMLKLDQLEIDGINIRNIVWHRSYYQPKYPEPWASQQISQGINLEEKILGETWFGHDGTWTLEFSSPFYKFIFDWMS